MTGQEQDRGRTFGIDMWATITAYAVALLMIVLATQLHAQTFTVVHAFTGGGDGGDPMSGLTMDSTGNFYGTTWSGGTSYGIVFKLWHVGGGWRISPIYSFAGGYDGAGPQARVVFGPGGSL